MLIRPPPGGFFIPFLPRPGRNEGRRRGRHPRYQSVKVSREAAERCVSEVCEQFRKPQDAEYISDFDRAMSKYLKAGRGDGE